MDGTPSEAAAEAVAAAKAAGGSPTTIAAAAGGVTLIIALHSGLSLSSAARKALQAQKIENLEDIAIHNTSVLRTIHSISPDHSLMSQVIKGYQVDNAIKLSKLISGKYQSIGHTRNLPQLAYATAKLLSGIGFHVDIDASRNAAVLARSYGANTSQVAIIAGLAAGHVASTVNGIAIEAGVAAATAARDSGSTSEVQATAAGVVAAAALAALGQTTAVQLHAAGVASGVNHYLESGSADTSGLVAAQAVKLQGGAKSSQIKEAGYVAGIVAVMAGSSNPSMAASATAKQLGGSVTEQATAAATAAASAANGVVGSTASAVGNAAAVAASSVAGLSKLDVAKVALTGAALALQRSGGTQQEVRAAALAAASHTAGDAALQDSTVMQALNLALGTDAAKSNTLIKFRTAISRLAGMKAAAGAAVVGGDGDSQVQAAAAAAATAMMSSGGDMALQVASAGAAAGAARAKLGATAAEVGSSAAAAAVAAGATIAQQAVAAGLAAGSSIVDGTPSEAASEAAAAAKAAGGSPTTIAAAAAAAAGGVVLNSDRSAASRVFKNVNKVVRKQYLPTEQYTLAMQHALLEVKYLVTYSRDMRKKLAQRFSKQVKNHLTTLLHVSGPEQDLIAGVAAASIAILTGGTQTEAARYAAHAVDADGSPVVNIAAGHGAAYAVMSSGGSPQEAANAAALSVLAEGGTTLQQAMIAASAAGHWSFGPSQGAVAGQAAAMASITKGSKSQAILAAMLAANTAGATRKECLTAAGLAAAMSTGGPLTVVLQKVVIHSARKIAGVQFIRARHAKAVKSTVTKAFAQPTMERIVAGLVEAILDAWKTKMSLDSLTTEQKGIEINLNHIVARRALAEAALKLSKQKGNHKHEINQAHRQLQQASAAVNQSQKRLKFLESTLQQSRKHAATRIGQIKQSRQHWLDSVTAAVQNRLALNRSGQIDVIGTQIRHILSRVVLLEPSYKLAAVAATYKDAMMELVREVI